MSEQPTFWGEVLGPSPLPERETPDRARTRRQAEALASGLHPLSLVLYRNLRLHRDAAPADDRSAAGRRCGNCQFRQVIEWHRRAWPKCIVESKYLDPNTPLDDYQRVSHGAATDVRAWWPACRDHEWGDPISPDAARSGPTGGDA